MTGTTCLLAIVIITVISSVVSQKKTTIDATVSGSKGNGARFDVGVSHKISKNWEIRGSGFVDSKKNKGGQIGLRFKFKKRSVKRAGEHFSLVIELNPCNFNVYDRNQDGIITKEEMNAVFTDRQLADKLFNALDFTNGDNMVTFDEFSFIAPQIIRGCENSNILPL